MKTLIVHPGSPKTATSTLQFILRQNRGRIARQGIGVMLPEDIRGQGFLGTYLSAYRGKIGPDIAAAAEEFFAPHRAANDVVVLSEETLCHDFMPSRKFADGGIDRADIAAELLAQSGFDQVKVVLTIRPQFELLTSTYTHFVHRHREFRQFGEWVKDEVALPRLLWQPAVQSFVERFGRDNVDVVSMQTARSDGFGGYLKAVFDALGLGAVNLDIAQDAVQNPSPSSRAVHLCRIMNKEIQNGKKAEAVGTCLVRQFPVSEFGKFTTRWTVPPELAELYAADHAAALARD